MSRSSTENSINGLLLIFYIAAFIGWILNIVAIVKAEAVTGFVIARALGVIMYPLGAVLGYF